VRNDTEKRRKEADNATLIAERLPPFSIFIASSWRFFRWRFFRSDNERIILFLSSLSKYPRAAAPAAVSIFASKVRENYALG